MTTTTLSDPEAGPAKDLITVLELVKREPALGHPESIRRLIRAGKFPPAVHVGRKVLISVPKLERYLHGEGA